MDRKKLILMRNKTGDEIETLKKTRNYNENEFELNEKINRLKKQYTFYNKLLKIIGAKNEKVR